MVLITYDLRSTPDDKEFNLNSKFKSTLMEKYEFVEEFIQPGGLTYTLPNTTLIRYNSNGQYAMSVAKRVCEDMEDEYLLDKGSLLERCFIVEFENWIGIPGQPYKDDD